MLLLLLVEPEPLEVICEIPMSTLPAMNLPPRAYIIERAIRSRRITKRIVQVRCIIEIDDGDEIWFLPPVASALVMSQSLSALPAAIRRFLGSVSAIDSELSMTRASID